jgi:hypothetical protein
MYAYDSHRYMIGFATDALSLSEMILKCFDRRELETTSFSQIQSEQ